MEGVARLGDGNVLRWRVVQHTDAIGRSLGPAHLEFRVNYRPVGDRTGQRLYAAACAARAVATPAAPVRPAALVLATSSW